MNKLLTRSCSPLLLALAAWALCPVVQAQSAAPVRAADFIVAVVNSEPVTNSEVLLIRNRLMRELSARGGQLPSLPQLNQLGLHNHHTHIPLFFLIYFNATVTALVKNDMKPRLTPCFSL